MIVIGDIADDECEDEDNSIKDEDDNSKNEDNSTSPTADISSDICLDDIFLRYFVVTKAFLRWLAP